MTVTRKQNCYWLVPCVIGLKYSCDVISAEGGWSAIASRAQRVIRQVTQANQPSMLTRSIIHIPVPVTGMVPPLPFRPDITFVVLLIGHIIVDSLLGDPRKMFTDSSFYSAKHHPTVADQVEMAHKLSSAMFNDKNK